MSFATELAHLTAQVDRLPLSPMARLRLATEALDRALVTRRGAGKVSMPKAPTVGGVGSTRPRGYHGWFVFVGKDEHGKAFDQNEVNEALTATTLSGAQRELLTSVRDNLINELAGANKQASAQLRAGALAIQKKLNGGAGSSTSGTKNKGSGSKGRKTGKSHGSKGRGKASMSSNAEAAQDKQQATSNKAEATQDKQQVTTAKAEAAQDKQQAQPKR